jgi:phage gpG-like protein
MPVDLASGEYLPPRLRKLIEDPSSVLKAIGNHLAAESREAWQKNSYGGIPWPEHYPGMDDSRFVHVAGAITDLLRGPAIRSKFLKRREPTLVGDGHLRRSINYQILSSRKVEVGAMKNVGDYAALHNKEGSKSKPVKISGGLRSNLAKVMKRAKRNPVKKKKLQTLGFLFNVDVYQQDIAWRPFIGITDQSRAMIPRIVKAAFEGTRINQVRS